MKKYSIILIASLLLTNIQAFAKEPWKTPNPQLRIDQISFVGAHNALMAEDDGWLYAQQKWGFIRLLDEGVRVFEIDVATEPSNKKGHKIKDNLFICHNSCTGAYKLQKKGPFHTFISQMDVLGKWLHKHPNEVVILAFDNKRDKNMLPNQGDMNIEKLHANIKNLILTPAIWNPEDHNGDWPTLQWMNDNKKQIIFFNPKQGDSPIYTYYHWRYVGCNRGDVSNSKMYTALRADSKDAFSPAQQEDRAKIQRMFQLNHSNLLSEEYALTAYKGVKQAEAFAKKAGSALGMNTDAKKAQEESDKLKTAQVSRSDFATIARIIEECKQAGLMGGKNPNILLLDWTDNFINTGGMALVNQWNEQTAAQMAK